MLAYLLTDKRKSYNLAKVKSFKVICLRKPFKKKNLFEILLKASQPASQPAIYP